MKRTIELLCLAVLSAVPVQVTGQAKPTVAIIGTGDMGNSLGPKIAAAWLPGRLRQPRAVAQDRAGTSAADWRERLRRKPA